MYVHEFENQFQSQKYLRADVYVRSAFMLYIEF